MSHPKTPPPQIATDATFLSGPDTGQPTRVSMSAGEQAQGVLAARFAAGKFNWMVGGMGDHVRNVAELGLRTWFKLETDPGHDPDDFVHGIFGFEQGAAGKTSRLVTYGSEATELFMRATVTRRGKVWSGTMFSPAAAGSVRDMAANQLGSVVVGVGLDMANKVQCSTSGGASFSNENTHHGGNYRSVCFHAGWFYAVQHLGAGVGKSLDGVTWTATTGTPSGVRGFARSGKSNGVPCVLLCNTSLSPICTISTDGGASWTNGSLIFGDTTAIVDVRYSEGAGMWMAISGGLRVAVSVDGLTWAVVKPASSTAVVRQLATDGGGAWVVGGTDPTCGGPFVGYSTDGGVTWWGKALDGDEITDGRVSVCWHPSEKCFFAALNDVGGAYPVQVFRTLSVGHDGGIASL